MHDASGEDVREEAAEQRHAVEGGEAAAGPAHGAGGAGARAAREGAKALVGDRDLQDRGGERGAGGVALGVRLTGAMPGDGPALRREVLQPTSGAPLFCAEGTGEGGEGVNRARGVGRAGRQGGLGV